jgi:AcrR family transcriptional regulator
MFRLSRAAIVRSIRAKQDDVKRHPAKGKKASARAPAARGVRADAQRNLSVLLAAAKAVFASSGVDAPVRAIAAQAGVGVATIYRHFPQRSDLIAAVFRQEIDACASAAPTLAGEHEPGEALAHWLRRYAGLIATKRGLAAALHSGDPAFEALPGYFRQQLEPALQSLLDAGVASGQIRDGIEPYELLRAIGNLSLATGEDANLHSRRMVDLLIDGLRYGARGAEPPPKAKRQPR